MHRTVPATTTRAPEIKLLTGRSARQSSPDRVVLHFATTHVRYPDILIPYRVFSEKQSLLASPRHLHPPPTRALLYSSPPPMLLHLEMLPTIRLKQPP
jgi:hypothetical protein